MLNLDLILKTWLYRMESINMNLTLKMKFTHLCNYKKEKKVQIQSQF